MTLKYAFPGLSSLAGAGSSFARGPAAGAQGLASGMNQLGMNIFRVEEERARQAFADKQQADAWAHQEKMQRDQNERSDKIRRQNEALKYGPYADAFGAIAKRSVLPQQHAPRGQAQFDAPWQGPPAADPGRKEISKEEYEKLLGPNREQVSKEEWGRAGDPGREQVSRSEWEARTGGSMRAHQRYGIDEETARRDMAPQYHDLYAQAYRLAGEAGIDVETAIGRIMKPKVEAAAKLREEQAKAQAKEVERHGKLSTAGDHYEKVYQKMFSTLNNALAEKMGVAAEAITGSRNPQLMRMVEGFKIKAAKEARETMGRLYGNSRGEYRAWGPFWEGQGGAPVPESERARADAALDAAIERAEAAEAAKAAKKAAPLAPADKVAVADLPESTKQRIGAVPGGRRADILAHPQGFVDAGPAPLVPRPSQSPGAAGAARAAGAAFGSSFGGGSDAPEYGPGADGPDAGSPWAQPSQTTNPGAMLDVPYGPQMTKLAETGRIPEDLVLWEGRMLSRGSALALEEAFADLEPDERALAAQAISSGYRPQSDAERDAIVRDLKAAGIEAPRLTTQQGLVDRWDKDTRRLRGEHPGWTEEQIEKHLEGKGKYKPRGVPETGMGNGAGHMAGNDVDVGKNALAGLPPELAERIRDGLKRAGFSPVSDVHYTRAR
jgi:hypothetical protein